MAANDLYRREVTEKVEAGWRIEEETPQRVTLVRRTVGSARTHLILAVLTIWWAMGLPNLLYGAYRYFANAERTVVWKEGAEPREEARAADVSPDSGE
jgi:hypothetical protein